MNAVTNPSIDSKKQSLLRKFYGWLKALDEGMSYDPMVDFSVSVRQMRQRTDELEARVIELENRETRL